MLSTPTHHLTSTDSQMIEVLTLQGFKKMEAVQAYFDCGRDVIKAADKLHNNREFNKRVRGNLNKVMRGQGTHMTFLDTGDDFKFVPDIFEEYEMER